MSEETAGISRRGFLGGVVAGTVTAPWAGPLSGSAQAQAEVPTEDLLAGSSVNTEDLLAQRLAGHPHPGESMNDLTPVLRNQLRTDTAWSKFLAEQDLIWKRMPRTWYEGPFLGNGFLAVSGYKEPGTNALRFKVDHSQVQDHRPAFGNEWGVARLPVGRLTLEPVGRITEVDLRLDLWNAELRGTITTDKGTLEINSIIHSERSVLLLVVGPSAGERDFKLAYHPAEALSPRTIREDPPAKLGRGNDALKYLRELVARFVQPNTMYYEAGPVIETPLSGAQSMHDMLCQSWGGVIRIFPAIPDEWRDVALHDFRTEGAFLVSASRKGGVTQFVRVRSLAGQPCRLRPGIQGQLVVRDQFGRPHRYREAGNGTIEIDLRHYEEVVVYAAGTRPDFTIAPVKVTTPGRRWGLPALPPSGQSEQVDISAHFNNDGISNEFTMVDGDFDGAGRTYPSVPLPQTGELTDDGIPFLFTNGSEGTLNNVVSAGQVITMPAGRYAKLHLLGASDNGDTNAGATVTYTDGSSASVPFALTDWRAQGPNFGESEAIRTNQMHTRSGPSNVKLAIFHQAIELDATRELRSITLPTTTRPRAHIFAITGERPTS